MKKHDHPIIRFMSNLGLLLSVLALLGTIIVYWNELRKIFPWMPEVTCTIERKGAAAEDDTKDFVDV